MRPLLVGMNNPYGADPKYALYPVPSHSAGGRLHAMLLSQRPIKLREYADWFERINLVTGSWSVAVARDVAACLLPTLAGRQVVLLGRDVQQAFGIAASEPLSVQYRDIAPQLVPRFSGGSVTFHVVPHPSGRNPWYNSPENRLAVATLLWRLLDEAAAERTQEQAGI